MQLVVLNQLKAVLVEDFQHCFHNVSTPNVFLDLKCVNKVKKRFQNNGWRERTLYKTQYLKERKKER